MEQAPGTGSSSPHACWFSRRRQQPLRLPGYFRHESRGPERPGRPEAAQRGWDSTRLRTPSPASHPATPATSPRARGGSEPPAAQQPAGPKGLLPPRRRAPLLERLCGRGQAHFRPRGARGSRPARPSWRRSAPGLPAGGPSRPGAGEGQGPGRGTAALPSRGGGLRAGREGRAGPRRPGARGRERRVPALGRRSAFWASRGRTWRRRRSSGQGGRPVLPKQALPQPLPGTSGPSRARVRTHSLPAPSPGLAGPPPLYAPSPSPEVSVLVPIL